MAYEWRVEYEGLVGRAAAEHVRNVLRPGANPFGRFFLYVKPAVPNGKWGEISIVDDNKEPPEGFRLAWNEPVRPMSLDHLKKWILSLNLPVIGAQ